MDYSALFGGGTTSTAPTQSAYALYQNLRQNGDKQFEDFKKQPQVKQEVDDFKEELGKVETVDEFIDNRKLMEYTLKAFGMEEELQYPGRLKKILTEPRDNDESLVNRMTDKRYRELADFLQFDTRGLGRIKLGGQQLELNEKYYLSEWEKSLGEQNPALREAAYFARKIEGTSNVYQLLGDQVLRKVTMETIGLPTEIAFQSVERQAAEVEKRVEIDELSRAAEGDTPQQQRLDTAKADQEKLTELQQSGQYVQTQANKLATDIATLQEDFAFIDTLSTATGDLQAKIDHQTDNTDEWIDTEGTLNAADNVISNIQTKMTEIQNLLNDTTDANLASNQTKVNSLVQEIQDEFNSATHKRSSDGQDINIFDSSFTSISASFAQGSDPVVTDGIDTTTLMARLNNVKDIYNAASSAGDVANISQAQARMANSQIDFDVVKSKLNQERSDFEAGIRSVDQLVTLVDSDKLTDARLSTSDALIRSNDLSTMMNQLRDMGLESLDKTGAERTQLEADYVTLRQNILDLVNTNASSTATQNLLNQDGAVGFEYKAGSSIWAEGKDMATQIDSLLPATLDAGGEAQFLNRIDQIRTVNNELNQNLQDQLTTLTRASTEFDTRGAANEKARSLASQAAALTNVEQDADGNNIPNLFTSNQTNLTETVNGTGVEVSVRAANNFQADVADKLSSAANNLLTNPTIALAELKSALYAVQDIEINAKSDLRSLRTQQSSLQTIITNNTPDTPVDTDFDLTNFNTDYTQKFIERYLITKDAEQNQASLTAGSSGDAYLLGLFA